jgi:hypothetical protein
MFLSFSAALQSFGPNYAASALMEELRCVRAVNISPLIPHTSRNFRASFYIMPVHTPRGGGSFIVLIKKELKRESRSETNNWKWPMFWQLPKTS